MKRPFACADSDNDGGVVRAIANLYSAADPDLVRLIAEWTELPDDLRQRILDLWRENRP